MFSNKEHFRINTSLSTKFHHFGQIGELPLGVRQQRFYRNCHLLKFITLSKYFYAICNQKKHFTQKTLVNRQALHTVQAITTMVANFSLVTIHSSACYYEEIPESGYLTRKRGLFGLMYLEIHRLRLASLSSSGGVLAGRVTRWHRASHSKREPVPLSA